jgi:hypothetical protein
MSKFEHLSKLEVQAELRLNELIPRKFWNEAYNALNDRLAEIEEQERQSEGFDVERRHQEQLEHSQTQLREQVRLHEDAMEQERTRHQGSLVESRRQFDTSLRVSQAAAGIAIVAALASVGSCWSSRVAPPVPALHDDSVSSAS